MPCWHQKSSKNALLFIYLFYFSCQVGFCMRWLIMFTKVEGICRHLIPLIAGRGVNSALRITALALWQRVKSNISDIWPLSTTCDNITGYVLCCAESLQKWYLYTIWKYSILLHTSSTCSLYTSPGQPERAVKRCGPYLCAQYTTTNDKASDNS